MIIAALIIIGIVLAVTTLISGRYAKKACAISGALLLLLGLFTFFDIGKTSVVELFSFGGITVSAALFVDGISIVLILLTLLLGIAAIFVSWSEITTREPEHYAILIALITMIVGVFASKDFVLLFVFWEMVLVMTFLLILLWGGPDRKHASMKFLLYTGIGSAALLAAIIIFAVSAGTTMMEMTTIPPLAGQIVFFLIAMACLIKLPAVPFHTWLPDAHVQAPTAGSMLLAGVMLKMGAYLLLRSTTLFQISDVTLLLLFAIGVLSALYGAWVCFAQQHLKRLIAYSSIHHMGLVLIAISVGGTYGTMAAVFAMVSHGLLSPLLFALAGLIHHKTGTYDLNGLSGLVRVLPKTAWLLVIAALASMGLPVFSAFIAEVLVFSFAIKTYGFLALLPLAAILLGGAYTLRLLAILFGPQRLNKLNDVELMQQFPILLLFVCSMLLGVAPMLLLTVLKVT